MIERKRRNDFVRKRELDLLRKLRRDGLTPEQLAVLGSSSGMADTETRADESELVAEPGMKARIDEIEQQMASHVIAATAPTAPATLPTPRENWLRQQRERQRDAAGFAESDAFARSMADTIIDASLLDEAALPASVRRRCSAGADVASGPGQHRVGGRGDRDRHTIPSSTRR